MMQQQPQQMQVQPQQTYQPNQMYQPQPTQMQQQQYAPTVSVLSLEAVLNEAHLNQYAQALREAGCVEAADLRDMDYDDFVSCGMKRIEILRLKRTISQ